MYEPAINPDTLDSQDSELTPIFHALVTRAADPAEHFQRDPLSAPMPVTPASPLAMARMLLSAVPVARLESSPVERAYPGSVGGSVRMRPSLASVASGGGSSDESGGRHEIREPRSPRSGRHRALRSVGLGVTESR
ncbi:hypothetical protein GCM10023321_01460 [Pseudonocardia eucalypti]|uniref:Uncharacterized protein n=1 Tax=Pseudonocardia eucalypti TaxID=648755 RepID=A0ABP9PD61_9PSEU|nr:hypothetical protein [Pseudonocardia eucalypti]